MSCWCEARDVENELIWPIHYVRRIKTNSKGGEKEGGKSELGRAREEVRQRRQRRERGRGRQEREE